MSVILESMLSTFLGIMAVWIATVIMTGFKIIFSCVLFTSVIICARRVSVCVRQCVPACACTCVCSLKMFKHNTNSQCTTPITTDVTPAFWQMWYFLESGAPERDGCNYTPRTKGYVTAAIQTEVMHPCMCVCVCVEGGVHHIMCICVFVLYIIYVHAILF